MKENLEPFERQTGNAVPGILSSRATERLRVGHMIGSLRIGGAERQVVNLLNELPPECAVLVTLREALGPLASDLHPLITRVRGGRVQWHNLPVAILLLARQLRRLQLDVLQTHLFWANFVGTLAAKVAGIPVIVTTEHGRNEQKPIWARWVERHLISRLADMRICVSDDVRRLRILEEGIPGEKLCVIANGTPVRERKQLSKRTPVVIGTLGRLIEAKDYRTLIRSAKCLREQDVNFRLVIVGDGPARPALLAEIERHGLEAAVELPGSSTDTHAWLDRFDIYAISSIREGQPLSLLEAMAVGLPIVATAVGGIPSTLMEGTEALLVPPADAEAMAAALAELASDLTLRQQLGAAARERQMRDYSVAASLQRHLSVYNKVIESKEKH